MRSHFHDILHIRMKINAFYTRYFHEVKQQRHRGLLSSSYPSRVYFFHLVSLKIRFVFFRHDLR